ncbi:hypothetical protein RhiirA1_532755 [Rhizophagus irregularis]|uniref:Uncharacterized protein n=1 Tax=Rhizophagus irregularis TaxID=588596 RepID=A0A2I1F2I4_9GLOM|nr:hypothetical protein RhiirA1_532755 [Rhizophagus irregularis]PKY28562.1 hypothetical protein RhiirB3_529945 [Rhizophagus irregularis]
MDKRMNDTYDYMRWMNERMNDLNGRNEQYKLENERHEWVNMRIKLLLFHSSTKKEATRNEKVRPRHHRGQSKERKRLWKRNIKRNKRALQLNSSSTDESTA